MSGVSPGGGVGIEHGILCNVLFLLATFDQLNLYNIAGIELLCRRLLMIQRAVKRNPLLPDFEGLDCYLFHTLDAEGGFLSSGFDAFIAEGQKTKGIIMKSTRLLKEEREAAAKKTANPKKGGNGDKGSDKNSCFKSSARNIRRQGGRWRQGRRR